MNILIISFCFPPYNVVGSLRTGKMAKYLHRMGHDVRVVAAADPSFPQTMPLEIPRRIVQYSKWLDINAPRLWFPLLKSIDNSVGQSPVGNENRNSKAMGSLKKIYRSFTNIPDKYMGWYPYACSKIREQMAKWKPDVIYASGPPFISLVVASRVSKKAGIPWVAELRDLWVDNHYRDYFRFRNTIDRFIERKVLSSAQGIVTVTPGFAETLENRYGEKVRIIINGYDAEDFKTETGPLMDGVLKITHTGSLYEGKRDPSSLFEALGKLGRLRSFIRISFVGGDPKVIINLAKKYHCADLVESIPSVSYAESLKLQQESDVLLLLTWDTPAEKAVCPAKFYEYAGARRPILLVGRKENIASDMILARRLGYVSKNPEEIASLLREWITAKCSGKTLESPQPEARAGFTREEQALEMIHLFEEIVARQK